MTFALARSLLLADAVRPEALAEALLMSATRGTSLVRALLAARAIEPARLDQQLERGDIPTMRHVAPVFSLVQQLPSELCERLLALPVRRDPRTGTIDVAVVDARDTHAVEEIAYWLKSPVRMVRTSLVSMEAALRQLHAKPNAGLRPLAAPMGANAPAGPPRRRADTPIYGSPALDGTGPPAAGTPAESATPEAEEETTDPNDRASVHVLVAPAANIPIPLLRKSIVPVAIVEVGARRPEREVVTDPMFDLKRRRTPPASSLDAIPPAPATTRGPFSPNAPAPPFDDVAPTLEALRTAGDRDAILELVVKGLRRAALRVAVLAVKRDSLVGWTCSPEMAERSTFRAARMPIPENSALEAVLKRDDAILARLPKDAAHAPLLAAMREAPSGEVALVAVRVEGKAVALVLADELGDTLLVTKRMQDIAHAAGDALGRLLRDKRK
jgi:hypothetical protein